MKSFRSGNPSTHYLLVHCVHLQSHPDSLNNPDIPSSLLLFFYPCPVGSNFHNLCSLNKRIVMQLSARRVRYKWQQFKANCQLDDAPPPRHPLRRSTRQRFGLVPVQPRPFLHLCHERASWQHSKACASPPSPLAPTELCLARNSALTTIRAGKGWGKQRDRVCVWVWGL